MNDIKSVLEKQRDFFESGATRGMGFRIDSLKRLRKAIGEYEGEILDGLKQDLNKSSFESYETELGMVREELNYCIKHLSKWAKPRRVRTPFTHFPAASYVYPEPYGCVLVMSPWNYPFQLTIAPLIGSIAAGNCTVLKPSAYSPHTSEAIAAMIGACFDQSYIAAVLGGREANQTLLDEKFDYIFFTGGVTVGKLVMESAARHLTPITLELGGKSPCIVDREADIELAAKRITWGKFLNAGQTCVAPDYLLVHSGVKDELLGKMARYIRDFYGDDSFGPESDLPRIVNEKHFHRLQGLMRQGKIVAGGQFDETTLQIAPTIIDGITWEDPIMQEEIFGPLLPVLTYEDLAEVVRDVNSRPKPLALYFFSSNRRHQERILKSISFGGGCINDTIVHLATSYMPFGGVGESGMGGYHGRASFTTFTHEKSILKKSNLVDIELRYPPYRNKLKLLKKVFG